MRDGQSGFLVPPADTYLLAKAMMAMLACSPVDLKIMGELGRAHVTKHFHMEAIHAVYLDTLRHYLKRAPNTEKQTPIVAKEITSPCSE